VEQLGAGSRPEGVKILAESASSLSDARSETSRSARRCA
jgi:hypothetical protein